MSRQGPRRTENVRRMAMAAGLLVAAVAFFLAPRRAQAVAYTFTPIADWGPGLGSINNAGTVAYVYTSPDGVQRVLTTSMDGTTTVIADTAGPLGNFHFSDSQGTTPAINDQGLVGFVAGTDAGARGIYTGDGGTLRLVEQIASGGGESSLSEQFREGRLLHAPIFGNRHPTGDR